MRENRGNRRCVISLFLVLGLLISLQSFAGNKGRPSKRQRRAAARQSEYDERQANRKFENEKAQTLAEAALDKDDYVNAYLRKLKLKPQEYNLTLKFLPKVPYAEEVFSPSSKPTISSFYSALGAKNYNNPVILGDAGSGKTFTTNQLISIFSYGKWPEFLNDVINKDNPLMAKLFKAYVGNTDFIKVNKILLSRNPETSGPASSVPLRMTQVINDLNDAAEAQFKATGRRTIFFVDEFAKLPDQVQEDLTSILDKSGFKDPDNPLEKLSDSGTLWAPITTLREFETMLAKDPTAVRRRFIEVHITPIPEDELLTELQKEKEKLKGTYPGLDIDDEALIYIIEMRKSLNSPPIAEPASSLRDLSLIYTWFAQTQSNSGEIKQITLLDAQKYVCKKLGLSDIFLPGPNGEPPLYQLAERLKKEVIGQDIAIDRFALSYQTSFLFGSRSPNYVVVGLSASGKNTFADALTRVLTGRSVKPIKITLGGKAGFSFDAIFIGPPLGNHSDDQQAILVKKMRGRMLPVVFDEIREASNQDLLKLREPVEDGSVTGQGLDNETRYFTIMPHLYLGEHGTELFKEAKNDEDIDHIYAALMQDQSLIDNALINPVGDPEFGHMSPSTIQRFKESGGEVILLKPVFKELYPEIVKLKDAIYVRAQKRRNNLDIEVDPEMYKAIARYTAVHGEDTRGLAANYTHFVSYAMTVAANKKEMLPYRNAKISLSASPTGVTLVSTQGNVTKIAKVTFEELFPGKTFSKECLVDLSDLTQVTRKKVVNQ